MSALVKFIGNDVFTDSMVIADGTGNEHNSVTRIIRNYRKDFEDLGNKVCGFEIQKTLGRKTNEDLSAQ